MSHSLTERRILQPYLDALGDCTERFDYEEVGVDPATHHIVLRPVYTNCCHKIFEESVVEVLFAKHCPVCNVLCTTRLTSLALRICISRCVQNNPVHFPDGYDVLLHKLQVSLHGLRKSIEFGSLRQAYADRAEEAQFVQARMSRLRLQLQEERSGYSADERELRIRNLERENQNLKVRMCFLLAVAVLVAIRCFFLNNFIFTLQGSLQRLNRLQCVG